MASVGLQMILFKNEFCAAPSLKPLTEQGIKSGTVIEMNMSLAYIWVILELVMFSTFPHYSSPVVSEVHRCDGPLTTHWELGHTQSESEFALHSVIRPFGCTAFCSVLPLHFVLFEPGAIP